MDETANHWYAAQASTHNISRPTGSSRRHRFVNPAGGIGGLAVHNAEKAVTYEDTAFYISSPL
jgi:hypothetical protein